MELRPGYKQTEVGVIPEEWEVKDLASRHPFVTSGSRGWAVFYSDRGSPFIRITNLSRESIYLDLTDLKYVNLPPEAKEGTRTQLQEHDVLISITADIGIVGYVTSDVPQPAYINQHIALVRFDSSSTDSRFMSYFLASENPQRLFRAFTDTGAKAGMSLVTVQKLKAAFPALPEQRVIAGALGDVDALLAALTQLIVKKRDLKQAAMQQLLTGQKRLPGFSGEWEMKRLGVVADIDPDNLGSETPSHYAFNYISLEDVDVGSLRSYSQQVFSSAPSRARRQLRVGDILVSTVRPNLQSHLLFTSTEPDWICSTGFSVVRCKSQDADPGYVFFHLFGHRVTKQIEAVLTGSNYPAINGGDVRALEIPIPSLPEQSAIVIVLSDMDAELSALEQRLAKTRDLKQGMMQELLAGKTRLI